jgi:hypothetical protein
MLSESGPTPGLDNASLMMTTRGHVTRGEARYCSSADRRASLVGKCEVLGRSSRRISRRALLDVGTGLNSELVEALGTGEGSSGSGPKSRAGAMPARERKLLNWLTMDSRARNAQHQSGRPPGDILYSQSSTANERLLPLRYSRMSISNSSARMRNVAVLAAPEGPERTRSLLYLASLGLYASVNQLATSVTFLGCTPSSDLRSKVSYLGLHHHPGGLTRDLGQNLSIHSSPSGPVASTARTG